MDTIRSLIILFFILSLGGESFSPELANAQGETSAPAQFQLPDSLRVTIDPGVFNLGKLRYEAKLRVSPLYGSDVESQRPESLIVWIDIESPGAFWTDPSAEDKYDNPSDHVLLRNDQVQVMGLVRWPLGGPIKVTAHFYNVSKTVVAIPTIPWLLLLISFAGGGLGGWLRRFREPHSVVDLPIKVLPKNLSVALQPIRETVIGTIAGLMLFLLNAVSPIYLEFRIPDGFEWLILAQPLFVGFIGGWGGINLLVGLLDQVFKRGGREHKSGTSTSRLP